MRELDELVATKIMRWVKGPIPNLSFGFRQAWVDSRSRGYRAELNWTPSADFAAAMMVVDKLDEEGYWAQMNTPFGKDEYNDGYWCGFTPHLATGWNGVPDHWTQADTLAKAICIAALDTKGVDVAKELAAQG